MVIVCFRQLHFWHRPVWPEESLKFTWNSDPGGQLTNISTRRQDWAAEIDLFHLRSPLSLFYLLWYRKHTQILPHQIFITPRKNINNKFTIDKIISTFWAAKKLPKRRCFLCLYPDIRMCCWYRFLFLSFSSLPLLNSVLRSILESEAVVEFGPQS